MPDIEKSDSPRVPAGRDRQLSSLARLAIVVGVPFATAFLGIPLWLTVLLLFGLAGLLFVGPHLSRKSPSDPKQAWMRLMASFIKLQSTYCDLKESPANATVLKQFSMFEERCLSLLSSRADSDWGPDSQYAPKIRKEVAAMSAEVRALSAKAAGPEMVGLILESKDVALHHDASPSPSTEPGAPTPTEKRDLAPAGAVKVLQPCSPALSAKPEVSIPAEKQSLNPLKEGTAVQPAGPILQANLDVPTSEGLLGLILASEGTAPRLDCPMAPARPDAPDPAEEQDLTLAGVGAAVQPDSNPLASAKAEVTTPVKEQVSALVSGSEAVQPDRPAPASRVEDQAPALEPVLTSANAAIALQSDSLVPPARDGAAIREEKQVLMLAYSGTASQSGSPAPSASLDAPIPAEGQGLVTASAGAALQPCSPAMPPTLDVPIAAAEQSSILASEAAALLRSSPESSQQRDLPTPAREPSPMPAGEATAMQPGSPAVPAGNEVPIREEKPVLTPAGEDTAVRPGDSAQPTKSEVPTPAEMQGLETAGKGEAVQPEVTTPPAKPDVAGPAGKRLTPYVWLPGGVEDAAAFYLSVFKNSLVKGMSRHPEGAGDVISATICLDGQELMLLNGGPAHKLPAASSLLVRCADQTEVDYYWQRLVSGGGEESMCGRLKDRFGVSWQVVPDALLELLNDPNPQRAARANEAMLKMKRIDIATLSEAVSQPEAVTLLPHATAPALLT